MNERISTSLRSSLRVASIAFGLGLALSMSAGVARAGGGGGSHGVPEVDPASALSALTLLTGGFLLITDRIRRARSSR
jgi:hypothetical protein